MTRHGTLPAGGMTIDANDEMLIVERSVIFKRSRNERFPQPRAVSVSDDKFRFVEVAVV